MSALRKRVRRIGFELEDGSWYAWRAVHGEPYRRIYFKTLADRSGVRPMVKHEVLHRSAGVRMEADEFDEDGMRLADVEFVTDPFPLSPQGHSDLVRALGHVERIYSTIAPMQGRDHAEGEFVGPERHHLSEQDVFLSRGKPGAQICVQSTLGLSLADIPQVYSAFGKRSQGWRNMHVFEPIRSASERALRLSLTRIRQSIGDDPSLDDPAALLGFLTALIAFLRGINAQPIRGGIKTYLPVMHRNDFATMFSLLHPSLRALLQSNQAHFVEAILAGVFGDPDGGIDDLDLAGFANQPVVKSLALTAHDRRTFTADLPLPTTLTLGRQGARIITYRPLPRTLSSGR